MIVLTLGANSGGEALVVTGADRSFEWPNWINFYRWIIVKLSAVFLINFATCWRLRANIRVLELLEERLELIGPS
jgi:hypothetical protein